MNQNEQQNGGEPLPSLLPVILWLEAGCDPKHAATELRMYEEKRAALSPSASAPVGEPVAWRDLTDEDRDAAFASMPNMLDGFMKLWGWLHFAQAIEAKVREKNAHLSASPLPQEPADAAMLWLCQVRDDFRRMAEDANRLLAQRCAELAALPQEPREAEQVCAEAYQVVGSLLSDLGKFDTDEAEKILDNLSQAKLVHKDVLPWPSYASGAQEGKAGEAEFAIEADGAFLASASGLRDEAWREIQHYAAQYAEEGPLTIYEVTRKKVATTESADSRGEKG